MNGPIDGAAILGIVLALALKITPVVLGLGAALWLLPRLRIGRSLLGRATEANDQGERLLALEGEVARLREELAEVQERQDFAERLLTPDRPLGQPHSRHSTPREVTPVS